MDIKIIAHRGANTKAPQNTMPAFIKAVAEGTDGFETDVHLSRDGKLVLCHNYTIDATSDGSGEITSYTLDELKKFDFGSYFSRDFAGTQIPTLDEFLNYVKNTHTEIINIELKSPKKRGTDIVRQTLRACREHGVLDKIIISSFDPRILKEVKDIEKSCKTAFLYPINRPSVCRLVLIPFVIVKEIGCDIIHPADIVVSKPLVSIAHKLGLKVNVWTVDDRKKVLKMAACGVDGIITDRPEEVRNILREVGIGEKLECHA